MDTGRSSNEQIKDERINGGSDVMGFFMGNPRKCMTCLNSNGEPPWADKPTKSYCIAYPRELDMRKPPSVYYEGADCEFYRGA